MKTTDPFYVSKRWEKRRAAILRRDKYTCQISKRYGRQVQANTVHHIFPRELFPEYEWESWNLISVCAKVHDQLHDRVSGSLTYKGIQLMERTARLNNIDIREALRRIAPRVSD